MKLKKVFFFFFCFFLVSICVPLTVHAEDASCTTQEMNRLRQLAANIKFSEELYYDPDYLEHYYKITVYNLPPELYIYESFFSTSFRYDAGSSTPGTVTVENYFGGITYQMRITGSQSSPCSGKLISSKYITLQKYNPYSEREECKGIETYAYCQKYSNLEIDEETFVRKVADYKKSLENKKPTNPENPNTKDKNWFQKFIDFYVDHLTWSLSITVIGVGLIGFGIYRLRENKKHTKRYQSSRRRKL